MKDDGGVEQSVLTTRITKFPGLFCFALFCFLLGLTPVLLSVICLTLIFVFSSSAHPAES